MEIERNSRKVDKQAIEKGRWKKKGRRRCKKKGRGMVEEGDCVGE